MRKAALLLVLLLVPSSLIAQESPVTVFPDMGSLSVFAANDRLIGVFAPIALPNDSIGGIVRVNVLKEGLIFLRVVRLQNGDMAWDTAPLRFTTKDCSGTGYGSLYSRTIGDRHAFVGPSGRLYIADLGTNPVFANFQSRAVLGEAGLECQEEYAGTNAIPLREVANLNEGFPPPFSLDPSGRTVRAVRH